METIKYKGYEIEITQDCDPLNPRTDWDNTGKMICFHGRYDLGDKHDYDSNDYEGWGEMGEDIIKQEDVLLIAPLYLYDHGGLRLKIGSFNGLLPQGHAEFDSGQIGFIVYTKDAVREWHLVKRISADLKSRCEKYMQGEVETYDDYLSGSVYGYRVDEIDDSCYGFFGYDHKKSGLLDYAEDAIDAHIRYSIKEHTQRVKGWIANKVPLVHREALTI